MASYIVLYAISPDQGAMIEPAKEGEPPVIVEEAVLLSTPSELLTNEERIQLLLDKGIIVPANEPERIPEALAKLSTVEAEAAASLRSITTRKE